MNNWHFTVNKSGKGQQVMASFTLKGQNRKGESAWAEKRWRDGLTGNPISADSVGPRLLKVNCFSPLSNLFDCSTSACVWLQAEEGGGVCGLCVWGGRVFSFQASRLLKQAAATV